MHRTVRSTAAHVGVLVLVATSFLATPPVRADQTASVTVPVAHLEGRGHGHGVGMSQWGAYSMAVEGRSAAEILASFYPGTQLGTAGGGVVVPIQAADRVQVHFPAGGEIRSSRDGPQQQRFPVKVAPGGTVELVRDPAGYRVVGGAVAPLQASAVEYSARQGDECILGICPPDGDDDPAPPVTNPPTTTRPPADDGGGDDEPDGDGGSPPPSSDAPPTTARNDPISPTPLWAVPADGTVHSVERGRTYRGTFEFTGSPGAARLRNHVGVEDYLKGMGEVPGSWPAAAVQAQAIAARTFALRAMAAGGEICDTDSCQVYGGVMHESPGQNAAVDATRGVAVFHNGGFASTFYSASGGGFSANVAEGFGNQGDVSYLPARPYDTVNPKAWSVDIALTDVAARLDYPGKIEDIRVDRAGPSGRALEMTIVGEAGDAQIDPQVFRRELGLQSTLFSVTTSEAEQPPPPPEPGDDVGVVGTTLSPTDRQVVRATAPVRSDERLLGQISYAELDPRTVPLPLLALAGALIALTAAVGTAHVGSRRRLHPVFALATTIVDARRGLARTLMASTRRALGTMARWTIRRR